MHHICPSNCRHGAPEAARETTDAWSTSFVWTIYLKANKTFYHGAGFRPPPGWQPDGMFNYERFHFEILIKAKWVQAGLSFHLSIIGLYQIGEDVPSPSLAERADKLCH